MSPNTVTDLASSFVQMAKAFEELPGVQRQLEGMTADRDKALSIIQAHELSILDYKSQIERLAEAVRDAEVARDDAEFRFLELDERAAKAVRFLAQVQGMAVQAELELSPPKPQPESITEAVHSIDELQAQPVDPKPEPQPSEFVGVQDDPTPVAMSGDPTNVDSWASGPGQSDTTPMEPSSMIDGGENTGQVSMPSESSKGRYSGKRYYDWATYIPRNEWLLGGGTEADYDWRPAGRSF